MGNAGGWLIFLFCLAYNFCMKNKRHENLIQKAKRAAKNHRHFNPVFLGVSVSPTKSLPKLTYWNSFECRAGSQILAGWITHPRMALKGLIEDEAHRRADEIYKNQSNRPSKNGSTIRVYRGKIVDLNEYEWYKEEIDNCRREVLKTAQFSVTPSLITRQHEWGRGVEICHPTEFNSHEDVVAFGLRVKEHLRGERNIFENLDTYSYSVADFVTEHPLWGAKAAK